jgi:hypothetical protein
MQTSLKTARMMPTKNADDSVMPAGDIRALPSASVHALYHAARQSQTK